MPMSEAGRRAIALGQKRRRAAEKNGTKPKRLIARKARTLNLRRPTQVIINFR